MNNITDPSRQVLQRCMEGGKIETSTSRLRCETKDFMVFKKDPGEMMCSYTQDVGDLCISLGKNEAFCVSATEYPGLNPNSVYFESIDTGLGFYDLSSNTVHDLTLHFLLMAYLLSRIKLLGAFVFTTILLFGVRFYPAIV